MTLQFSLASEIAETAEWPSAALGEIVDILDSRRKPITKRDRVAGPYPYYGATGILDWVEGYIFDEPLVLIGEDGARWGAGEASAFPVSGKVWVNNHAHVMRPDRKRLLDEWLIYYLNAADLSEFISGMTVPKLNQGRLKEIPIPIPPLEEQKRIVAVLDQAFAALDRARANAEANLADADVLFATTKTQVFTEANENAEMVDLGEVASIVTTLTDPKLPGNQGLPHVGAGNMLTGSDELVDVLTAKEEGLKSGKFPFTTGVVLYSKIRPYLKKVARPEFDGLCSADVYPLTPSDRINRDYLFHLLLSDDFTEYAIKGSARAGMPKVNQNHLFAYRFGLPSLETQREAVAKIDAAFRYTSRLKLTYQNKMQDLDDLRQTILQKAFAGDLS